MRTKPEPKDDSKAAPEVFNAPARDDPEPEQATERPSSRATGIKSNGVPAGRLAGFALPVLAVVAGAAMWAVSPLLAVGLFGGTVAAGGAGYVAHRAWKRRGRIGSTAAALRGPVGSAVPSARTGFRNRGALASLLHGGPRRAGSSTSGGIGTGNRGRSLLGRKHPGGNTEPGAGRTGGASSGLRSKLFGRRSGSNSTRGGTGSVPTRRSRANNGSGRSSRGVAGSSSTTRGRLAPSASRGKVSGPGGGLATRSGNGLFGGRKNPTGSTPGGAPTSRGVGRDKKRRYFAHVDPGFTGGRTRTGDKGSDLEIPKLRGKVVKTTRDAEAKDPGTKPVQDAAGEVPALSGKRTRMRNHPLVDDGGFFSPGPQKPNQKSALVDDAGFPANTQSAPEKPAPVSAPTYDDTPVDDFGFPLTPITPQAEGRNTNTERNKMSAATSEGIQSGYAHMIDNSTPESRARTLNEAAQEARLSATHHEELARQARAEAAALDGMKGMRETAERFLREAAALDEVALKRRGMAGAYEELAGDAAKAGA